MNRFFNKSILWNLFKALTLLILSYRMLLANFREVYSDHLPQAWSLIGSPQPSPIQQIIEVLGFHGLSPQIYNEIFLIQNFTPKNAVIFVPPQSNNFGFTGNCGLFRAFITARTPVNSLLDQLEAAPLHPLYIKHPPNFVLISPGMELGINMDPKASFWPQFKVPAKRWIINNRLIANGLPPAPTELINIDGDFDPQLYTQKYLGRWGLIFLED